MNSLLLIAFLSLSFCIPIKAAPPYGQLSVKGSQLVGSNGQPVQLVGMSLFWSSCGEGEVFYNKATVNSLKCSWNSNVVRAAMGVEYSGCQRPGYLDAPNVELGKVEAVVKAAIELDMYVILDFHDHNAQSHVKQAIEFFTYFAQNYGSKYPNIIYETFNEPLQVDWNGVKSYHEQVVAEIRKYDTKNVIVLGTTTWSQDVDTAANNPVSGTNLCYSLHFYAATHKQNLRDKAQAAINKGACIFVTEYGTVDASGGGGVDEGSTKEWYNFLDSNKISNLNWAISNKAEGASALTSGTSASQVGNDDRLTASGLIVKKYIKSKNTGVSCSGASSSSGSGSKPSGNKPSNSESSTAKTSGNSGNKGGNSNTGSNANNSGSKSGNSGSNTGNTGSNAGANSGNTGTSTGSSSVTASVQVPDKWDNGARFQLVFKNNASTKKCGVKFSLTFASGQQITGIWNVQNVTGNNFVLPDYVTIEAGKQYTDAGMNINGPATPPQIKVLGDGKCVH
uniref:Endoglucanase n=5 Tax=Meloidogyne TaxID=189290 RepID=A2VA30_MELJA|nr:beta-1,4-endoglucanase [Meloidogyne javanica]CAD2128618.1 unnamed protein product [Meloidogyne enterolobii]CAJ77137.1 cellulase [Meloidogyne javanica]